MTEHLLLPLPLDGSQKKVLSEPQVHNKYANTAPSGAVYIGRGSRWGNPFRIGVDGTREEVIEKFRTQILPKLNCEELRGKHLVCFCKPAFCHGDLILTKANK